ncbi:MAG: cytochrome b5 domain-containing protein [Patescibacteria group bacterium]|jgi:predicted heme/steroid binding protein/uncharacterized integral membrane protein
MKYLIKIDRIAAWILLSSMFGYFISGYGMSKGIISAELSTKIHLSYLSYIILASFIIHTSYAIHLAFKRWRIWQMPGKIALILFFIFFFVAFLYIDKFYEKKSTNIINNTVSTNTAIDTENKAVEKSFTEEELAKYNGQNNMPAYVAVDGKVYDLTQVFRNGSHFSHIAGTELTDAFYSYHAKQAISKYPVVGQFVP